MKRITLILFVLSLSDLAYPQETDTSSVEKKVSLLRMDEIKTLNYELIYNILDSLHSEILDFVDYDSRIDNEIISLLEKERKYSPEISMDTFAVHYLELELKGGGKFCFQRGATYPEKKYKKKNRASIQMMEFHTEIHKRKAIPFELIKRYCVDFDLCIDKYKYYFEYSLIFNDKNDIEIEHKCFTRLR